jgi:hypothetical protein
MSTAEIMFVSRIAAFRLLPCACSAVQGCRVKSRFAAVPGIVGGENSASGDKQRWSCGLMTRRNLNAGITRSSRLAAIAGAGRAQTVSRSIDFARQLVLGPPQTTWHADFCTAPTLTLAVHTLPTPAPAVLHISNMTLFHLACACVVARVKFVPSQLCTTSLRSFPSRLTVPYEIPTGPVR